MGSVGATDMEVRMFAKGYASARMVAKKTHRHLASVLRIVKTGKVSGVKMGGQYFFLITSVMDYYGPEGSAALDLHDWSDVFKDV